MTGRRTFWIDAGMALGAAVLLALVVFVRHSDAFVPTLLVFMVVFTGWAFLVEWIEATAVGQDEALGAEVTGRRRPPEALSH